MSFGSWERVPFMVTGYRNELIRGFDTCTAKSAARYGRKISQRAAAHRNRDGRHIFTGSLRHPR